MPDYTLDTSIDSVTITSQTKITLQVGPNSIVIDTSGVTINCMNLTLQAQAQAKLTAALYQESVSGINQVGGALIKIGG